MKSASPAGGCHGIHCDQRGENPDRLFGGDGSDILAAANGKKDILDCGGGPGDGYDIVHTNEVNGQFEDVFTASHGCEEIRT